MSDTPPEVPVPASIQIVSTITFEQYQAASAAVNDPPGTLWWWPRWLPPWFPATLVVMLIWSAESTGHVANMVTACLILLLAPFLWYQWQRHSFLRMRRYQFQLSESFLNGQQLTIALEGINASILDGAITMTYAWRAFDRCLDLPDAFLFVHGKLTYVRVAKLSLSPEDDQLLRSWIPHNLLVPTPAVLP